MKLHVPSVAKVEATLVGALVRSVLKGNDGIAGSQLFLGEVARILFGFFGADGRLAILGRLYIR